MPPSNIAHAAALAAGVWGAWETYKKGLSVFSGLGLAAGAWGAWQFSRFGWIRAAPLPTPSVTTPMVPSVPGAPVPTPPPAGYPETPSFGTSLANLLHQLTGGVYAPHAQPGASQPGAPGTVPVTPGLGPWAQPGATGCAGCGYAATGCPSECGMLNPYPAAWNLRADQPSPSLPPQGLEATWDELSLAEKMELRGL